ncbi:MAG: TVP38/TMEM64 family protein [Anaerolineae bacterium]|nr:TVP38/TMEM64 family protein [Anaerolineae bacterium]
MNIQVSLHKDKLIKIGLAIIILATAWIYRQPLSELLQTIQDQEAVSTYLEGYGKFGPVILFILLIAQVFVAIIPGHVLMVTAGYVYGTLGLFVTITSTILGSQIAFLVARHFGRSLIFRIAPPKIINRWDGAARNQGILFYFFSFVLPIFPSDLMCYVAGLSTISPRRFFVANLLGRIFTAVFVTLIGVYGMHPPVQFWLVAIAGMLVLFLGWAIFKHKRTNSIQRVLNLKHN